MCDFVKDLLNIYSVPRKLISGTHGNVTLEVTDTTGSHQFPAMRRLSVVRGELLGLLMDFLIFLCRACFCDGVQYFLKAKPDRAEAHPGADQ